MSQQSGSRLLICKLSWSALDTSWDIFALFRSYLGLFSTYLDLLGNFWVLKESLTWEREIECVGIVAE